MCDWTTCILLLIDFQIFQLVLKARDNAEIVLLLFIDLFVWLLAVINSHK